MIAIASPTFSAPDEVRWSRVNIPTEGKLGGWVLARGSDIKHLAVTAQGTLYAYADPVGTSCTLFKSEDDGYSWSYIGGVEDEIVDIAPHPEDEDVVYYATPSSVYKSSDGGDSFTELPPGPGGSGSDSVEISAIAVAQVAGHSVVAVGTKDADSSEYGGVYLLEEVEELFPSWVDIEIGGYDVHSVALSPNFAEDGVTVAIVTDETHTYAAYNYGTIGDWDMVELLDASNASFAATGASNIGLESDFSEPYPLLVGVVGGDGGIYEVDEDQAQRLDGIDADIISLGVTRESGAVEMLAGENGSAQVWFSHDGGSSWDQATKAPTGNGSTYVVMAPDFASSGRAYAATSGGESAVSCTEDSGDTWNQIGLVDTAVTTIIDLALSPDYSKDKALFMLTWGGGGHSLWRSLNDAARWERVFGSQLPDVDSLSLVSLPPQYGSGNQVVFLAGLRSGSPVIWKSSDNGQNFSYRRTAPLPVDAWAVVDEATFFMGGYDGGNGLIYLATDSGRSYSTGTVVGSEPLNSIVLSPDYGTDETLLVGSSDGWVYCSGDNGASFEPLPPDATSSPLGGSVSVAFDPGFNNNRIVYAASDTPDTGIYRFTIGKSTAWEVIDSPTGGMFKQILVSVDGTLYATNFKADGGMERCLNPTYSLGPTFKTVSRGLDGGATLTSLWLLDNRLWATDTANNRLMTFTDSLAVPVVLTSPADQAQGVGIVIDDAVKSVELDWETLNGATEYEWQVDDDPDLSSAPPLFEGSTGASSEQLPTLELATTYYWRVRAIEPILSPWSEKWFFTTAMGGKAAGPELISPEASATGVPVRPLFQWSAIAGAECYELMVSNKASFDNPAILKSGDCALSNTAWECNLNLDYKTTYYWKVRAVSSETYGTWSAVGAFTTEGEPSSQERIAADTSRPSSPEEPKPPTEEPPSSATTIPDWAKYLMGALLAAVILLSIIVLILVRNMKRP